MTLVVGRERDGDPAWLNDAAGRSLLRAIAAGCPVSITSAGRTAEAQQVLRTAYLAGRAAYAETVERSEHVTGNAIDAAGSMLTWLRLHGADHGWIHTGGSAEPWHYAYRLPRDKHLAPTFPNLTPLPPTEDDDMLPTFIRRSDGLIVALTGRGAHRLTAVEWSVWTNLGVGVFPPGMSSMDPGPFQVVVDTVGGYIEDATPSVTALAAAIVASMPKVDAATVAALVVAALPAGTTPPTADEIAAELAARLAS